MSYPASQLLPEAVLLELLPAAFEPWGSSSWYPSRPPADASVGRIERELGVRIPPLMISVAGACAAYGGWFGSIGDDFDSHNHMLSINRAFRAEGMPPRYVLLNHGHDGDCDAWDLEAPLATDEEKPIVYFHFDGERRALCDMKNSAMSFAGYIDAFVRSHAPRCPEEKLRLRAKKILADYGAELD